MGKLSTELKRGAADMDGLATWLDGLTNAERSAEILTLNKAAQRTLWTLCSERTVGIEDLVPVGTPSLKPVRHLGKNSLPVFSRFEKRFCRIDADPNLLVGYNEGPTRPLVGPGYFTTRLCDEADRGATVIDYTIIRTEQAEGWPKIKPNTSGMCKIVYGEMLDYMRKVSTHVTIGKAWKFGKETENYFMLLREDGADLS
jgi:hypothetical protein